MPIYTKHSNYFELSDFNKLSADFRDLKLKIISDEFNFEISEDAKKNFKNELSFLKRNFPNDIITGSLALSLFGLIDRVLSDLDLLIKDSGRYSKYNSNSYDTEITPLNRLGYIEFNFKKNLFSKRMYWEVDFFKDDGVNYIEFLFEGVKLKIHPPMDVISFKLKMIGDIFLLYPYDHSKVIPRSNLHKHFLDLYEIFKKIL